MRERVHSRDDAQQELKGENKVEEGGGGEEEEEEEGRRESLWPTLNAVLFQGQPHTHWNGYTKTESKQATYNVLFHWKVRIALQKMIFF